MPRPNESEKKNPRMPCGMGMSFAGPESGPGGIYPLMAFTRALMLSSGVPMDTPHPTEITLNPA